MVASNSTNRDQGAIGEFALGEFVQGTPFAFLPSIGFTDPVRYRRLPAAAIALIASGAITPPFTDDGKITGSWMRQLNEPVRQKVGLHASRQQFFTFGNINFPERVDEAKWHYPWSEPKRFPKGLAPHLQQTFTADTSPVPTSKGIGWYASLSEPVRQKPGLAARLQQTFTWDTASIPVTRGLRWYANLSDPVRLPKGLKSHLQQAFTIDMDLVPPVDSGFYYAFSEPVRFKKGLAAYEQQFLAYHPRILPNPNVTVTINGIETNRDEALFAVNVYDASSSTIVGQGAKVSIIEVTPTGQPLAMGGNPVSVRET